MLVTDTKLERTGELTMRQAAEWLGFGSSVRAGRNLRRRLEKLERKTGRELIIREGGPRGYLVTKSMLRDVLPHHFSQREQVERLVRQYHADQDKAVQDLRAELKSLKRVFGPRIRRLESAFRKFEESLGLGKGQTTADHSEPRNRPSGEGSHAGAPHPE